MRGEMSEDVALLHQPSREVSEEALARAEEMIEREEGVHNKLSGFLAGLVTTCMRLGYSTISVRTATGLPVNLSVPLYASSVASAMVSAM